MYGVQVDCLWLTADGNAVSEPTYPYSTELEAHVAGVNCGFVYKVRKQGCVS